MKMIDVSIDGVVAVHPLHDWFYTVYYDNVCERNGYIEAASYLDAIEAVKDLFHNHTVNNVGVSFVS